MVQYIYPPFLLLESTTIFAAISHNVDQDSGPLLKYRHHLLGLRLVTSNLFNLVVSLARFLIPSLNLVERLCLW